MLFSLRYIGKNSTLGSILLKQQDRIGISGISEERESCSVYTICAQIRKCRQYPVRTIVTAV